MAEMLLLNPAKRRAKKSHRTAAQKRATAKMLAANRRSRSGGRARRSVTVALNPSKRRASRRRRNNPISMVRRRRRNPISLGGGTSIINMFKGAAISGIGAVAMDAAIGQIQKFLPPAMLGESGKVDQGNAVKAGLTVIIGKLLARPTRGWSMRAAQASLAIQAYDIAATLLPDSIPLAGSGLGYASPARIVNGSPRIGPNVRQSVQRFVPGTPQLLNQYTGAGNTPLLNGIAARMSREGFAYR
jgi:hypothetical protein